MAIDARGKYVVIPEVCQQQVIIVPFPAPIPKGDRLDEPNDRWPTDPEALAGNGVSIDCDLLIGGCKYGEQESNGS